MIVLGLTGSIGMGKSTLAAMLEEMGCPVHDSDRVVHRLLGSGGAAREAVRAQFPEAWDEAAQAIDRKKLSEIIFHDAGQRQSLEAILHPAVRQSQEKFLAEKRAEGYEIAVLEIPLLFETDADKRVDFTIVASAPEGVQRARVLARPAMTEEKFQAILSSQIPDAEKRRRADFIVDTGIDPAHSRAILAEIVEGVKNAK